MAKFIVSYEGEEKFPALVALPDVVAGVDVLGQLLVPRQWQFDGIQGLRGLSRLPFRLLVHEFLLRDDHHLRMSCAHVAQLHLPAHSPRK